MILCLVPMFNRHYFNPKERERSVRVKLFTLTVIFILNCVNVVNAKAGEQTSLSLSAHFKLKIDTKKLTDAKIIASGPTSMIVAFDDGSYFDATVITNSLENLSEDFDLRFYPEYLLDIAGTNSLPKVVQDKFSAAACELKQRVNNAKPLIESDNQYKRYTLLYGNEITSFVVDKNVQSQILLINSVDLNQKFINTLLKGEDSVE